MNWPRVFSLLAHELRSPAAVISGYAHMLGEGRLGEDDRLKAYAQMERAASRMVLLGQQAGDLARWLAADASTAGQALDIRTLVTRGIARAASPDRVSAEFVANADTLVVRTLNRDALSAALGTVIDAAGREVVDGGLRVVARIAEPARACDLLVGPSPVVSALDTTDGLTTDPLSLDRSGLGLALVLAVAIVNAHGGQIMTAGGQRDLFVIRLVAGH